jgi:hypothetical protein
MKRFSRSYSIAFTQTSPLSSPAAPGDSPEENSGMRNVVLTAALALAAAAPAEAQIQWLDQVFVNINAGAQTSSHEASVSGSFSLYEETSTFQGRREIGGGALFDISAGTRVWRNLAVGVGYSRFGDSGSMDITALVPDRLIPGSPHEQTIAAGELDHSENAVHFSATWFWPVTDKIDVAVSAGPSVFSISQDSVTIMQDNVQPGTSNLTGVTRVDASETTVGFHTGVDVTYLVTPRFGAGLLLRYAGGSTDIGGADVDVGGFQIGVGLRVRF